VKRSLCWALGLLATVAFVAFAPLAAGAQEGDLLDEILARKEIRIGTYLVYKPLMFKDESGEPQGFEIDLNKKLAETLGVKLTLVDNEWRGIIPGLLSKKYDVLWAGVGRTVQRMLAVEFTEPYWYTETVVLVPTAGKIKTAEDLNQQETKVGCGTGDVNCEIAKRYYQNVQIVTFPVSADAYAAVKLGKVDAYSTDRLRAMALDKDAPGALHMITIDRPGALIKVAAAVRPGPQSQHFLRFVNQWLRELKDTGEYDKIYAKWFPGMPIPERIGW
jgi:polar amino acid transport system substrate-binding protein